MADWESRGGAAPQAHRRAAPEAGARTPRACLLVACLALASLAGAMPSQRTLCPAGCQKHAALNLLEHSQGGGHACGWVDARVELDRILQEIELGARGGGVGGALGGPLSPCRLRGGRGGPAMITSSVGRMHKAELHQALRDRGLTTIGKKKDLVARLEEALRHDPDGKRVASGDAVGPSAKRSRVSHTGIGAIPPIPDSAFYDKSTLRFVPPTGTRRGLELLAEMKDSTESDYIYEVFPQQAEAFRFADARPGFQLQVFAEDKDCNGAKKYVVATYNGFWRVYSRIDRSRLHFAEVIREGNACRLYFDLEFRIEEGENVAEAHARGNSYVDGMVDALFPALQERFGDLVQSPPRILELDSCTDIKFSRHLVVPNIVFKDTSHAGAFVKHFAEILPPDISSCIDLGVYTRNRCFRMIHSAKYGKETVFVHSKRPMKYRWSSEKDTNPLMRMMYMSTHPSQAGGFDPNKNIFLHSLICHTTDSEVVLEDPGVHNKSASNGLDNDNDNSTSTGLQARGLYSSESAEYQRSPFPEVDQYVCNVARPGAQIQRWIFFRGNGRISYTLNRNRFCENIDRCHKSNRVSIVCDLARGLWWQTCLDQDCRSVNFKSKERPLPRDLFESRLQEELDPELPDSAGSVTSSPVSARTEELREKARGERRELARKKLTVTHEAFAAISARQANGTLNAATRRAALDGAIIISVNMTSGGHVVIKNCMEVWKELKSLGFVYDLGQRGWISGIRDVLHRAGVECEHDGECDEGCVSRELVLQMIERAYFMDSKRLTETPPEASPPLPDATCEDSGLIASVEGGLVVVKVPHSTFYRDKGRLCKLGFVWDDSRRAYTIAEGDIQELIKEGSQEVTPESVLDLVARAPTCDVEVSRQDVIIRDPSHSEACLRRAGFAWQEPMKAWRMPSDTALRFLRAFSIKDVTSEAVLEALEAVEDPQEESQSPTPMEDTSSSSALKRGKFQLSESDLKISDDTLTVFNAPRDMRESLKRILGFRWNPDLHALEKPVDGVLSLMGMDFESGIQDQEVLPEDMTIGAALDLLVRAHAYCEKEGMSARKAYLKFEEGQVLVRNSFEQKDMLRSAGFSYDKDKKAWVKDYEDVEDMLGSEEVTVDNVMDRVAQIWKENGGEQVDARRPSESKEAFVKIGNDEVYVFNSFSMRDALKALGFRWDAERRAWASPTEKVMEQLETSFQSDITTEALTLAASRVKASSPPLDAESGTASRKAFLKVVGDKVSVFQSYDVKDQLRARGFRFEAEAKAWCRPVSEILAALGVNDVSEITMDAILLSGEVTRENAKQSQEPPGPELKVEGDSVLIVRSFSIKQQLRDRGFRWDSQRSAWTRPLNEVLELCGVASKEELTLQHVLSVVVAALNLNEDGGRGGL